jgi:hypothetical protein
MAKQTFSVGQVLTAAQMTSLQETAMGGGAASAKTANYVLVAADAGTTISMTSTSATTITVNTGLFAAGDTVFIQNLGSGTLTITAGTATVNTAGSLILPQYDAGILYFVSASSAIFYDYIQVGATSPLTTKGDIYVYGTSDTRLGVGANGTTLVADSAETTGLKWATPTGASGPAFFVSKTGNQSISQNTWTKATMTVEEFDTDSCFASSTFTPNKAGYYQVSSTVNTQQGSGSGRQKAFYKNGAIFNLWQTSDDSSPTEVDNGSTLFYMNGTTDYLEVYVLLTSSTTRTIGSDDKGTMFCGVWIRS